MARPVYPVLALALLTSPAWADGASGLAAAPMGMWQAGPSCRSGHPSRPPNNFGVWEMGPCGGPYGAERGFKPIPGGEAIVERRRATPASTAPQLGLFSTLHNVER